MNITTLGTPKFVKGQKIWRLFEDTYAAPLPVEFEAYESEDYAYVRIGDRSYAVEVKYLYTTYEEAYIEQDKRRNDIVTYHKNQGWQ